MSLVEAVANVIAGYCIALATQLFLFPMLGARLSTVQNASIAAVFTLVSIIRSYCLRRLFERLNRCGWDHGRAD
jgi:hypothetical protein